MMTVAIAEAPSKRLADERLAEEYWAHNANKCFVRRHISMPAVSLYDYVRALSQARASHGLYFRNDRRTAAEFGVSCNRIGRLFNELLSAGFIEQVSAKTRVKGSKFYIAGRYRVLSHEEWAKTHPRRCPSFGHEGFKMESSTEASRLHGGKIKTPKRKNQDSILEKSRLHSGVVVSNEVLYGESERQSERQSEKAKSESKPTAVLALPAPKGKGDGQQNLKLAEDLAKDLADIGYRYDLAFDAKRVAGLAELLDDYTPDEFKTVFRIYVSRLSLEDAFELKHAARKFVETAPQLIEAERREHARRKREEGAFARADALAKAKADARVAEIEKRQAEEDELWDEEIDGARPVPFAPALLAKALVLP